MSTPENNPNPSEKPDQQPGQSGQNGDVAPRYGQNAPYGQNTPQYGQNSPYGQSSPYGQQSGQPGQASPYGQNQPYGQQPYGQNTPSPYGYQNAQPGQYGYPSSQPQGGTGKPEAPKEVMIAFWLIIAAAALTAINSILILTNLDSELEAAFRDPALRDMLAQSEGEISQQELMDMTAGFAGISVVIAALIGIGLYLMVAFGVKAGKNWARITGTVFAALSLFFLIPFGLQTLVVLLGIAAIVLLFMPNSNNFFKAVAARKFGIYGR